jgi:NADPH-dependent 2,4-dienoyl-CoA reductase/sulfur reductase-like enzyme
MGKTDVLVVGGSAAGIVAATTAKSFYSDKSVMLVRQESQVLVPCGIPYVFGTLDSSDQNCVPDAGLANAGVTLKIDEVVSIDSENKTCKTSGGTEIGFEKLVLATGSTPTKPSWLKGVDLENVFTIPKDKIYLDNFKICLDAFKKVVVIGGGFIGVEMADELAKSGKDITLVEMMPHVLAMAFDEELALKAQEVLQSRGVKIKTGSGVKEINGDGKVTGITLNNDETIEADAVILSIGYRPNAVLAEKAGLAINKLGSIQVNEYMRTENPDIFAVGDCAEKRSFITRTLKPTMLASTACAEARIAAMNLYKLSMVRLFGGTISIFCTSIGDHAFGAAGVTENLAKERGFDIQTATFEGVDRHPGTLPDTHKQIVKLIVSKESGFILGGEIMGGKSVGELTNLIGFVIQNRMTVDALLTSQIGTHPLLTGPPTAYPLIKAAEMIAKQRRAS